ncbi:unnamed protein product [Vitrella brassicaformis CCMP3155]|uniref:Uncharacterized protein n=1 Tax=Vitrella brassicaformis (strain CCMP3155) TaxID=1169540 RepID=A0A0G4GTR5_VITBC|nr:unnamed protein product [Vitrella brassicaformis CCMP3155]|eukprot:CEM34112.1 unnamed protein product [Vitrella brassicaformis CCMP3155]
MMVTQRFGLIGLILVVWLAIVQPLMAAKRTDYGGGASTELSALKAQQMSLVQLQLDNAVEAISAAHKLNTAAQELNTAAQERMAAAMKAIEAADTATTGNCINNTAACGGKADGTPCNLSDGTKCKCFGGKCKPCCAGGGCRCH